MPPSTTASWAKGYTKHFPNRRPVQQAPVITCLDERGAGRLRVPFIGLVEATVVQAFRQTGLPLQRIRKALDVLAEEGELPHALASHRLYTDGAQVLYDYANTSGDKALRLLTVVHSGQRVFHEVIAEYLKLITFEDTWATGLILPITTDPILHVQPTVASGDPLFVHGGAPLTAVLSRAKAGEPAGSLAEDYGVPLADIEEALQAVAPQAA
jgi:uncharacterized protein (DUF433 family)